MIYPTLNSYGQSTLRINALDGGLNEQANAQDIADKQLSKCLNLWHKNGKLKTRPAAVAKEKAQLTGAYSGGKVLSYRRDGIDYDIVVCFGSDFADCVIVNKSDGVSTKISMIIADDGYTVNNILPFCADYDNFNRGDNIDGTGVFMFLSLSDRSGANHYKIMHLLYNTAEKQFQLRKDNKPIFVDPSPIRLEEDGSIEGGDYSFNYYDQDTDCHVPQLLLNGKGTEYSTLPTNDQTEYSPAVSYEGASLLTPYAKFSYMSDGVSTVFSLPTYIRIDIHHPVRIEYSFSLDYSYKADDGTQQSTTAEVNAVFHTACRRYNAGKIEVLKHTWQTDLPDRYPKLKLNYRFAGDLEGESTKCNRFYLSLTLPEPNQSGATTIPIPRFSVNNISIVGALWSYDEDNAGALFSSKICDSYSASTGVENGATLFFADGDKKNRLYYTDISRLYMSENAWIDIGQPDERITGFGKQTGAFIIFKERSLYYMGEVENENVTADDIIAGKIIDVSLSKYYYPVFPLSSYVGCNDGAYIRLCCNRLVFAGSDGEIYAIRYISNKSTANNIMKLSDNIKRSERKKGGMAFKFRDYYGVTAAPDSGIYVLNTDNYGFVSSSTYYKESSSRMQEWYYWTLSELLTKMGSLVFIGESENENDTTIYAAALSGNNTNIVAISFTASAENDEYIDGEGKSTSLPIPVALSTKSYTMNNPFARKIVSKVFFEADKSNKDDSSAYAEAVVYGDSEQRYERIDLKKDAVKMNGNKLSAMTDTIAAHRIIANMRSTRTVGLSISAHGNINIGAITVYYRQIGEIK